MSSQSTDSDWASDKEISESGASLSSVQKEDEASSSEEISSKTKKDSNEKENQLQQEKSEKESDSSFQFEEEEEEDYKEDFPDFNQTFPNPIYQTLFKFTFDLNLTYEGTSLSTSSQLFKTPVCDFQLIFTFSEDIINVSITSTSKYVFFADFSVTLFQTVTSLKNEKIKKKTSNISFQEPIPFKKDSPTEAVFEVLFRPPPNLSRLFFGNVGIINDGMTCYLSSLLQSLFHLKSFRNIVYSISPNKNEIVDALSIVFAFLQFSEFPVSTRILTSAFGWKTDELYNQNDVHELLKLLFDRIDTSCENQASLLFTGEHKQTITADGYQTSSQVPFTDLSLFVKNFNNLEESIQDFYQPDKFTEDNQYQLPDGSKKDAELTLSITKFPKILCILLRRFEYDQGTMKKISSKVEWSSNLNFFNETYSIFSIIAHAGNVFGGHYCSFVKKGDLWLMFDDENIYVLNEINVMKMTFGGSPNNFTGYYFFYVKNTDLDIIFGEDPPVNMALLEAEKEKRLYREIVVFCPETIFQPNDEQETVVILNCKIFPRIELVSKKLKILRTISNKELCDLISKEIFNGQNVFLRIISSNEPMKEFLPLNDDCFVLHQIYASLDEQIPFLPCIFLPGFEPVELPVLLADQNSSVEILSKKLCDFLQIKSISLQFYVVYKDTIVLQFTSLLDCFQNLYFQIPSFDDEIFQKVKEKLNLISLPFLDFDASVYTFEDYFKYIKKRINIHFIHTGNQIQPFQLLLYHDMPVQEIISTLQKRLTNDQSLLDPSSKIEVKHILLFKATNSINKPSIQPIYVNLQLPYIKGQSNTLYFDIAPTDSCFRYDVQYLNSSASQKKMIPLFHDSNKISYENFISLTSQNHNFSDFFLYFIDDLGPMLINPGDEITPNKRIVLFEGIFQNPAAIIYYPATCPMENLGEISDQIFYHFEPNKTVEDCLNLLSKSGTPFLMQKEKKMLKKSKVEKTSLLSEVIDPIFVVIQPQPLMPNLSLSTPLRIKKV